jgi:hypothetical protein
MRTPQKTLSQIELTVAIRPLPKAEIADPTSFRCAARLRHPMRRKENRPSTRARSNLCCSHVGAWLRQIRPVAQLSVVAVPVVMVPVMTVIAPVTVMMPTVVITPMAMIAHFGGQLAGFILHRRGGNRTAQRQGLCALGRRGHDEQSRNRRKAQNSLRVHVYPPWTQDVGIKAIAPASCNNESPLYRSVRLVDAN